MKKLLLLLLVLVGLAALTASAGTQFNAKNWGAMKTYDVRDLAPALEKHTGEWVALKFNFRGNEVRHWKPNWYEGSLWQPSPRGKKGFAHLKIMVSKKDLAAFKAITIDSTAGEEMTAYGKVARDSDARWVFVRLVGRKASPDSSGGATVDW